MYAAATVLQKDLRCFQRGSKWFCMLTSVCLCTCARACVIVLNDATMIYCWYCCEGPLLAAGDDGNGNKCGVRPPAPPIKDGLTSLAWHAAEYSYAPYTHGKSGVAIQAAAPDGSGTDVVAWGGVIENAVSSKVNIKRQTVESNIFVVHGRDIEDAWSMPLPRFLHT